MSFLLQLHVDHVAHVHNNLAPVLQTLSAAALDKPALDAQVTALVAACQPHATSSHFEVLLRQDLLNVAAQEIMAVKQDPAAYYALLRGRLDLALSLAEHGGCDDTVPWAILEDVLKCQTVETCSHIFAWIEQRADRLTVNMGTAKAKSLTLLRTLNDLLRRVSKTGSTTTFCGRILLFLSSVFELGERSGVNLRGEYGPEWEPVQKAVSSEAELSPTEEKRDAFYHDFWQLQTPFSKPTKFALPSTFSSFRTSSGTVLSTLIEATKRERVLMGTKNQGATPAAAGTKRKREDLEREDADKTQYFFAKFLTKPELLELEIADPQFRRQILFQMLILLQYLLNFTEAEKKEWQTPRNSALQINFTLDEDGEKWCKETWAKVVEELRSMSPHGRQYTDTLLLILRLERNWVKWKAAGCPPFDKPALPQSAFRAQARERRKKILAPPPPPEWSHGSKGLSEMWDRGWDEIDDAMTAPVVEHDLKSFARMIAQQDQRIKMRTMQLERMKPKPAPAAAAAAASPAPSGEATASKDGEAKPSNGAVAAPPPAKPKPVPTDPTIKLAEDEKHKQSWLALRHARLHHLHLMSSIKTSGGEMVPELVKAVEEDEAKRAAGLQKARDAEAGESMAVDDAAGEDGEAVEKTDEGELGLAVDKADAEDEIKTEEADAVVEADVKMEDEAAAAVTVEDAPAMQEETDAHESQTPERSVALQLPSETEDVPMGESAPSNSMQSMQ
ncbi:THO complex subunit 1 transcription elongation factor-domain-containing protein [Auriculariales sp. MPI-PUGE-AT-0066]|nr:THO complex subunit 1 transcription elongation factor-domain-containing protein [Auriculariales sp. MPI-PUGE-AT-0066]